MNKRRALPNPNLTIRTLWLAALLVLTVLALVPVQMVFAADINVNTTDDDEADGCGVNDCTLREAIGDAGTGDTVVIPAGTYVLASGQLVINNDITLQGAGMDLTIIDGDENDRVLINGYTTVINDLTIQNGEIEGDPGDPGYDVYGGGIINYGTLTLNRVKVTDNRVYGGAGDDNGTGGDGGDAYGGGIYTAEGLSTLTLNDSIVSDNWAVCGNGGSGGGNGGFGGSGYGGGIYSEYDTVTLNNTDVTDNIAVGGGGGFGGEGSDGEPGRGYGGGIYMYYESLNPGTLHVENGSSITGNIAENDGGGIYNDFDQVFISDSDVSQNMAGNYFLDGTFQEDCLSVIEGRGGGIFTTGGRVEAPREDGEGQPGDVTLVNSNVSENQACAGGGGIFGGGGVRTVTVEQGSLINGNVAPFGGGLYNDFDNRLVVDDSTVSDNIASHGGGIFNNGTLEILNDSVISGNTAIGYDYGYMDGGAMVAGLTSGFLASPALQPGSEWSEGGVGGGIANGLCIYYILYYEEPGVAAGECGLFDIDETTISGNTATAGAGGLAEPPFFVPLSPFISAGMGGGVANLSDDYWSEIRNSVLNNNSALWGSYEPGENGEGPPEGGPVGGGLANYNAYGLLNLYNVTFSGNESEGAGGGLITGPVWLYDEDLMGGYFLASNITVTENTATYGGGVFVDGAGYTAPLSYTEGEGGGEEENAYFWNDLIAGNTSTGEYDAQPFPPDCVDTTIEDDGTNYFGYSDDFNLIGDLGSDIANEVTLYLVCDFFSEPGDVELDDDLGLPVSSVLSPTLAANGGPTNTHALVPGSPAIDTIDDGYCDYADIESGPTSLDRDQRNSPRPVDGDLNGSLLCDRGAFEYIPGEEPGPGDEGGGPAAVVPIKTVDREVAAIGDTLTYTLRWPNPTDHTIGTVVVEDVLDARLDNVTVVSNSHGTPSITGNTIRVDGFELAAGEVFEMVFTAVISDRAAVGDVIANMATLESPDASVHLSNTVRTTIVGLLPDTGFGPERAIPVWLLPVLLGAIVAVCAGFVLSWKRRETQAG